MNYKIIQDKKSFKEFINWLPDLLPHEQFYVCLFARKKYAPESGLTNDKSQLKRFTSTKERLFDKVRQLECPIGAYKSSRGEAIPQEALALYITPNPRDLFKASKETAKELVNRICESRDSTNPKSLALDKIQKSCTRKIFYDFDIDYKGELKPNSYTNEYGIFLKEWIPDRVGYTTDVKYLEGRGGYHVLIKLDSIEENYKKTWHQNISKNQYIDMSGDLLIPVIGCSQGGFIPKFI